MIVQFEAKFRIIVSEPIFAPDKETAKKMAEAIASRIFRDNNNFHYVELAEITEYEPRSKRKSSEDNPAE